MNESVAIGIDLGATNLKAAIVDQCGRILRKHVRQIGDSRPDSVIAAMVEMVVGMVQEERIDRAALRGVGVGAPGPLSHRTGRILRSANLPEWKNVPLRDRLQELLQLRVVLDNDGNAAAFGEYWAGAGRGGGDLVMFTLGTGVGGGVVLDGQVLHGHHENAAELGHIIVCVDGLPCPCGQRGCLEQYASAAGVARRVVNAVREGEASLVASTARKSEPIDAEHVVRAAREGDSLCARIWNEACLYLAIACVTIQHTFNPARIVLGGGMAGAGSFLVDAVAAHLARQRWSLHEDLPTITLAELGYDAGIVGAAGMVWQRCGQHP